MSVIRMRGLISLRAGLLSALLLGVGFDLAALAAPGDWPEPRGDAQLTASQAMPGAMREAPRVLAEIDLGRSRPGVTPVEPPPDAPEGAKTIGLAVVAGELQAYALDGALLWRSHPPGLNFLSVVAAEDLNGDGKAEALVECGRAAAPYGAAVLVALDDGRVLWRHDVDPMSYDWHARVGSYLPGESGKQITVMMHAYPPDKKNGYIALFDWPSGDAPRQRWRYDFDQYTCFPSLLQTDLDGDGAQELVVETHSKMWLLDAPTGAVKSFAQWDVSPANIRSYGHIEFSDIDGDGRDDFLCIANFAQHHEVLLNKGGKLEKAWHHGWPESVTTGKVATRWAEPPLSDIDGDGKLEVVLSMFNSENEGAWLLRVYDAVTGELKLRAPGLVAAACVDVDDDGAAEILAEPSSDPTFTAKSGVRLLKSDGKELKEIWRDDAAQAKTGPARKGGKKGKRRKAAEIKDEDAEGPQELVVLKDGAQFQLLWQDGGVKLAPWNKAPRAGPDFSKIPEAVGGSVATLLAADVDSDGVNELILYREPQARAFKLKGGKPEPCGEFASTSIPVIADLDGDGKNEVVTSKIGPEAAPVVEAATPALGKALWRAEFPPPGRAGLPQPRRAYIRAIKLTGKKTPDLYVWAGTPIVRSAALEGATGKLLWDKGECPEIDGRKIERYWGASVNYASAADFNGDGKEDLVFTNPDYYCVADGPTGQPRLGPLYPPEIFKQPSQGLYTYPAILERKEKPPIVALVAGHYFQAAMTIGGEAYWHRLPEPGENRCAAEAFARGEGGEWLMGFGRQNGALACVGAEDGKLRWELPLEASGSDAASGDIDGDGKMEFVIGTSHGELIAVGEGQGADGRTAPRVVWRARVDAGVGSPILADLDGDGKIEIAAHCTDGRVRVWGAR